MKMAADQSQFEQLIASLLSSENEIRTQGETTYDDIPVATKVPYLLTSIRNASASEEVRQMAAVLLRRLFSSEFEDFFPKLSPEEKTQFQEQLLLTIQQETNSGLRKKICDATAEVARNLIDDEGNNSWPEFLKFLFDCANSSVPGLQESSLQMFGAVPGIFGNQQPMYLDVIKQMLQRSLQESNDVKVRFAAMKAMTSFLLVHDKEPAIQTRFTDLLPSLIQGIGESICQLEDDALMKCLVDLAENVPNYLRSQILNIFKLLLKVLEGENIPTGWKHLAIEVFVTLSETAPAMVRKHGSKFIPQFITYSVNMMVDIEDDEQWAESDEITEDDSDSNAVVGESALDRMACGLGGKTVLHQLIAQVSPMLSAPEWQRRHAALMAISSVGEGCHKQMEPLLPQIMDGVLNFLQDPHPRVRYAACNAIGQMSSDFAPIFQKKFHDKIVPGLLMVMDDNNHPRVQAHGGAALVNFCEDCPKTILSSYLENIICRLETILRAKLDELVTKGTKLVLEQIVTTIASVADTSEEKFTNYYDRFIPCLKYIIQNANLPELRLLRGKTIECVSLIGLAVGPDKFMPDANDIMDLLLKAQNSAEGGLAEDDPQVSYMISAWARICKVLGKRFEQYLPLVMDPVMKTASLKPEVAILDVDDMQTVEGDEEWQFVSLGEQQNFGIRTAGLEDKATACQMLVCYARELKEGFAGYTEDVVKLMVPMLKFYFHDGVRSAAAESLPYLLECAQIKGPNYVTDMWNYICPELIKAIDSEPESDVLCEHLNSMAKCIELMGKGSLMEEHMGELIKILERQLTEHFTKADERQEKRKGEDYDDVVEEALLNEDDDDVYILSKVSDVVHSLFATYKSTFFVYFDTLLPLFVKLLEPGRSWSDHQWAICVFDDVIEHGGPECVKYQEYFLPHMMSHIKNESPEVRQAICYGWGVLGQFGGELFAGVCSEAIPCLVELINAPESRNFENINSTENAIAAVTKILKFNSSRVNVDEVLPHWLTWFPVFQDEDEAPHVYDYLCDLIERNNPHVLGSNNSNLPAILLIITEAFMKEAVDHETPVLDRMIGIVRQIQSNPEVFQACLVRLSPDQQQTLHTYLSKH
ncbi:hypothetical protein CHUAL_008922 [Chamberlinius hualienensis]